MAKVETPSQLNSIEERLRKRKEAAAELGPELDHAHAQAQGSALPKKTEKESPKPSGPKPKFEEHELLRNRVRKGTGDLLKLHAATRSLKEGRTVSVQEALDDILRNALAYLEGDNK